MDKRRVELEFGIDIGSFDADAQELERRHRETLTKLQSGVDTGASMSPAPSSGVAPPSSSSHDALQNALGATSGDVPWRELVDAVRQLTDITAENADTARKTNETAQRNLAWQQANALMNLGNQTVNQVAQGNFFGAAGGAIGGLLGLPFGPGGMAAGASIGGMAGNFLQGLSTGAGGARAYTADATDLARRLGGLNNLAPLQDYGLGSEQGYKAEETLSQMGRLQATRLASSGGEAAQLVPAIQQLTRALGLNVEATIDLYQGYVQSGGDRGGDGFRDYMAQVVGGAISAGFESNVQMYGELMNSARSQSVATSGSMMSDKAFGQLQGILANLSGTDSRASRLFRENPQFAQAGMGTYMAMGGAGDPYSTQAGYLRLAGVAEHQIDRRFIDQETQMANAGKAMGFLGDQMMQYSGMSREQFQAAAAADPNFVREQMSGNVNLQRLMGTQLLPGLIGREASAQDIRAFEQLSNIAIANDGQLPTGTADGSAKVDELLAQLNASPADAARQAEAERHNKQLEVMSNFQNLMTKTDEWMANIYGWISENLDLAAIEETILSVMDRFGTFVGETALPFITDQAIPFVEQGIEAAQALAQWAKDNNIGEKLGNVGRIAGARSYEEFTSGNTGVGFDGKFDGPLSNLVRRIHGRFNDTPGDGVTAREGYNTFQFAEGDQVFAFQGGGDTLGDLLQALENILSAGIEYSELTKELHSERLALDAETFEVLALSGEHHAAVTEFQAEQTEKIFPLMEAHLAAIADATSLMPSVDQGIQDLIGMTADIATMVQMLQSIGGGMSGGGAGGGGGAFASGLYTGPSANIGGSSAYHIDTKFNKSQSWEQIVGYFDQMAEGYAADDRRIEFSNAAVSGEVYDHTASMEEKIKLLRRAAAAHSHSMHANWHSFDYYIPQGDDSRHGSSAEGAEMLLPSIAGGSVQYGTASGYGNFATILDADGNAVLKTGHGDNRRALPASRNLPAASVGIGAGGSGPLNLASGYESLEGLAGQLSQNQYFNQSTPEGRAALALALGIGGSEVYSRGSTQTDFFTRRGGTGNNMLGFAQFNLRYHRQNVDTPGEYTNFIGQMMHGERTQPNGRGGRDWAAQLNSAIAAGRVSSGQDMVEWMQSSGLGGSNWQGVDDGWSRVPGLADQLYEYAAGGVAPRNVSRGRRPVARNITYTPGGNVHGGGVQTLAYSPDSSSSITLNITVNVNGGAGNVRQQAYEGTAAAVDEFEQQWRGEPPRKQPKSAKDFSYS